MSGGGVPRSGRPVRCGRPGRVGRVFRAGRPATVPPVGAGVAAVAVAVACILGGCTTGGTADRQSAANRPAVSHLPTPPGVAEVVLSAPAEHGAGTVPVFRWAVAGGATRYQLFVRDARGQPIWAWQGSDTTVRLGGLAVDRPDNGGGPRLVRGSTWLVVALGPDGRVRAVSAIRPVDP